MPVARLQWSCEQSGFRSLQAELAKSGFWKASWNNRTTHRQEKLQTAILSVSCSMWFCELPNACHVTIPFVISILHKPADTTNSTEEKSSDSSNNKSLFVVVLRAHFRTVMLHFRNTIVLPLCDTCNLPACLANKQPGLQCKGE